MTYTHFHKIVGVTLGSLLTFSSSTFASTSSVKATVTATRLGNSEILVVQQAVSGNTAFLKAVAVAKTASGNGASVGLNCLVGLRKSAFAEYIPKIQSLL